MHSQGLCSSHRAALCPLTLHHEERHQPLRNGRLVLGAVTRDERECLCCDRVRFWRGVVEELNEGRQPTRLRYRMPVCIIDREVAKCTGSALLGCTRGGMHILGKLGAGQGGCAGWYWRVELYLVACGIASRQEAHERDDASSSCDHMKPVATSLHSGSFRWRGLALARTAVTNAISLGRG